MGGETIRPAFSSGNMRDCRPIPKRRTHGTSRSKLTAGQQLAYSKWVTKQRKDHPVPRAGGYANSGCASDAIRRHEGRYFTIEAFMRTDVYRQLAE